MEVCAIDFPYLKVSELCLILEAINITLSDVELDICGGNI